MPASNPITRDLLRWYDRHRRALPWRAPPGGAVDPYRVWLSEIMLQQTTVAAVKPYFEAFVSRWPDVEALAGAPREAVMAAWAGLGYYARARNLHDCARSVVDRCGGRFPEEEAALRALPGVGDYTAAALAAIAFGHPAAVVDGNVERVVARLFEIETPLPRARTAIRCIVAGLVPPERPGDFAQAMMDLGATLCTPRSPACAICPLARDCGARISGDPTLFPKRLPKVARPRRFGAVAVIARADGAVLVRSRPPSGLLGGMTEFFGTEWSASPADDGALRRAADLDLAVVGQVDHAFTHFALTLEVFRGRAAGAEVSGYRWASPEQLACEPLPGVMTKVLRVARKGSALVRVGAADLSLVGLERPDEQRGRNREDHEPQTLRGAGKRQELAKPQGSGNDA